MDNKINTNLEQILKALLANSEQKLIGNSSSFPAQEIASRTAARGGPVAQTSTVSVIAYFTFMIFF